MGLREPEEVSTEVEFGKVVGMLMDSAGIDLISSFVTLFSVAFSTCPDTESLSSLLSTRTLALLLILLVCREFVLRGGAGGSLVFITDRLRAKFCLVFASSPAAIEPERADSHL